MRRFVVYPVVGLLLMGVFQVATAAEAKKPVASGRDLSSIPSSAITDDDIIAYINKKIREGWAGAEISPSPMATDAEWCRRVYLDILGRIPSIDELNQFLGSKSAKKRAELIDRLVGNSESEDRYLEEYARNWTTVWTNILIGRPKAAREEQRDMVDREGMHQYLRSSFLRNKPYDKLVYELVSATGSNKPGEPDYNGATNFLLDNLQEMGTTATAKVARYFLGLQVQCTQCHNHPFNDWKQNQFWSMNAFFRQTKGNRTMQGRMVSSAKLVNQDFAGESNNPKDASIFYELRNGVIEIAYPKFVDGTEINHSGYTAEVDRRAELGKLITKSEYLGKAIVNRMWAHFMGYAFTKPLDDMGPHNAATHPELLEKLGKEFAAQGHDLKRLIKWVTLSDPYALSSKIGATNKKDDPSLGEKPLFSRFYVRQMQAEQLYASLLTATDALKTKGDREAQEKTMQTWLQQFTLAFGTDEGDESTTFNGTIPQALMMMNGELVKTASSLEPGSFLNQVLNAGKGNKLEYLYMAALARKPNPVEASSAAYLISQRGGDTAAAMQDVWWAILNSNEFILQH